MSLIIHSTVFNNTLFFTRFIEIFNMMKYVLLVALVVVAAHAQNADVVQSAFEPNENGYEFNYKLSDDTERKESAQSAPQSAPDSDDGGTEAQGNYAFKTPEGRSIKVVYTGGKDGFKPKVVFERR